MGIGELALGDPAAALAALAAARRLVDSENGPEDWRSVVLRNTLAYVTSSIGDHATARSEAQRSVAVSRQLGQPTALANSLALQGHFLCNVRPEEALALLEPAIGLYEAGAADAMYASALADVAVLRAESADSSAAARAARTALRHTARVGARPNVADQVEVAAVVLASLAAGFTTAATLDAARHGPVLGHIPPTYTAIHQARIDAARERVAAGLGAETFAAAQQRGPGPVALPLYQ